MTSFWDVELAHVLHIEHLADVKQTVTILEQETRLRLNDYICSFVVVRDAFEAFEVLAHKRFECIIIDEKVEFNSYEAVQTIRTLMPEVPILMILHSRATELELALQNSEAAGCTHLLMNNFTNEEYCAALKSMLLKKENLFQSLDNITHFPWDKHSPVVKVENATNFHNFPLHKAKICIPPPPVPPPALPASLVKHPSMSPDLLTNAKQFFDAQRSANLEQNIKISAEIRPSGPDGIEIPNLHSGYKKFDFDHHDQIESQTFDEAMLIFDAANKTTV